jgi:hypothetical protein
MALAVVAAMLGAASAETDLTGAGATFPYPMYSKWFNEYHNQHSDIKINYQSIGSGGGIKQIQAGTVDFGASDGPMTDEQIAQTPGKVFHIPTVLGADVPTYNVTGVTGELKFTPNVLADLFLGKIKKWNDPRLAKDNPGIKFPDEDIVIVHRSDGCWYGPSRAESHRGRLLKNVHNTSLRRRLSNWTALGFITLAALIVTVPFFLILGTVVVRGLGTFNWAFLTQIPKPIGEEGGGMGNAILGSILLLGFAS